MRFLIDNALSPEIARRLADAGHDAVHVRDLGLAAATDVAIFARAAEDDRVLLSADTDFGTILALRAVRRPSVILWRRAAPRRPAQQASILLEVIPTLQEALEAGAIVVLEAHRVRIRMLPIGGGEATGQ